MYQPYLLPISIKGILFEDAKVWLRKNERDEWELPGGKLDEGEQPTETARRELLEELGVECSVDPQPVDAYLYTIQKSIDESHGVLVVSYLCTLQKRVGDVEHIGEAGKAEFAQFAIGAIAQDDFKMPDFYKTAIMRAARQVGLYE